MKKHANIPIFIPHEGCRNECVFCNQRTITGTCQSSDRDIIPEIESALSTIDDNTEVEIAFFGGSFTGIGKDKMTRLCDDAYRFVKDGRVKSIRLSTRPDYIDAEILDILKARGVTHIELGIQSMRQQVLDECKRGHTTTDTEKACSLIRDYGFILGGQMMIGLPCSTAEDELYTAKRIVEMGAKEARIYPCIVFEGTELCSMAKSGKYTPLSVDDAVKRSADVYKVFRENGVNVLRIGLQSSEKLSSDDAVFAGANHPAMGELVMGEYYYSLILSRLGEIKKLENNTKDSRLIIYCSEKNVSKISGQNKRNKTRLLDVIKKFGFTDITILGKAEFDDDTITFDIQNTDEKKAEENQCT
ncbi:MAG: radical SAM protein [Clostridia bacterium]|nr:radical SAM protein [Clostridia bacterium]